MTQRFDATSREPGPIIVLDESLTLPGLEAIAHGRAPLTLGAGAQARLAAARVRLASAIAERRLVYGITTGFGPLADRLISPEDAAALQRKLVYHLASGVGRPLAFAQARACVAARLGALARGWSGASEHAIAALVALLNSDLAPLIPEKGTVGASGDLTPLAHLALALMGEGGFVDRDGQSVANAEAFARLGIAPLRLADRDGLALVNGTSAMTGVAALNATEAARLLDWACALTVGAAEALFGRAEAWAPEFAQARPHPGQAEAAERLRARAQGSRRLEFMRAANTILADASPGLARPLQDPYTLRTAPQVLGAAFEVAAFHADIVGRELNAATDNPILTAEPPFALHGGNFQGVHVALASDAMKNALVAAAGLTERQIARLTDSAKNGGWPAFLSGGRAGLDSGLMGAQVTASALLAEMRGRAGPASAHSISTNGDNQDVVSLGTIAARGAAEAVEDFARIIAIGALSVSQAAALMGEEDFAPATRAMIEQTREIAPPIAEDRPLAREIELLARFVRNESPSMG